MAKSKLFAVLFIRIRFLVLLYFTVLNVFYYFFDKNSKADVTQVIVKYLPDEAFNIEGETVRGNNGNIDKVNTEKSQCSIR